MPASAPHIVRHLLLLLTAMACGCSANPSLVRLDGSMPNPSQDQANQARLNALFVERQTTQSVSEYKITTGDLLSITIHGYRPGGGDFLTDARVDEMGYLNLPMITPLRAAGLTIGDVREALADALQRAEVMRQPKITIFLKDYLGRQVVVLGAVGRPGRYELARGQEALVDVLSMAGGLQSSAGNYLILRPYSGNSQGAGASGLQVAYTLSSPNGNDMPLTGSEGVVVVPLGSGAAANSSLLTLPVRGGDIIVVPEAGQAFVEGKVAKPGVYPLRHGMTLSQLLANAGGLTFPAKRGSLQLVRSTNLGESSQWLIDLDRIRKQELDDVLLEPNDRVVVPASPVKMVPWGIYQLALTVVRISVGGALTLF